MACDKVFYIFALVLLHISYSESTMTECEKIYLPKCGRGFVSEWKKRDANMTPKQKLAIYCNSFQSYAKCLSEDSNSCSGVTIGLMRHGIGQHLLVNQKTKLCPNMDLSAIASSLQDLAKKDIPEKVAKHFELKEIGKDEAVECDLTASRECAINIAENFIKHFKANACFSDESNYVFACFESKTCNGKLSRDFRFTLKKIGKLVMKEQKPYLDNCKNKQ